MENAAQVNDEFYKHGLCPSLPVMYLARSRAMKRDVLRTYLTDSSAQLVAVNGDATDKEDGGDGDELDRDLDRDAKLSN